MGSPGPTASLRIFQSVKHCACAGWFLLCGVRRDREKRPARDLRDPYANAERPYELAILGRKRLQSANDRSLHWATLPVMHLGFVPCHGSTDSDLQYVPREVHDRGRRARREHLRRGLLTL